MTEKQKSLLAKREKLYEQLAEIDQKIEESLDIGDKVYYVKNLMSGREVTIRGKIVGANLGTKGKVKTFKVQPFDSFYETKLTEDGTVNKKPSSLILCQDEE